MTDTLLFNGAVVDTPSWSASARFRRTKDVEWCSTSRFRRPPGVLENDVDFTACTTHPCVKVVLPVRRPLINELVVEPQHDWNDSGGGGNGMLFDDTPGTSVAPSPSVTPGDQWLELLTNTGSPAELTNWTL